jgi:hypothetical protein
LLVPLLFLSYSENTSPRLLFWLVRGRIVVENKIRRRRRILPSESMFAEHAFSEREAFTGEKKGKH